MRLILALLAVAAAAAAPATVQAAAAAQQASVSATAQVAAVAAAARSVAPGGALTVSDYKLAGDALPSTLLLQRFEMWQPGSTVHVSTADGQQLRLAPPDARFFRGRIAGAPGSAVMLSVRASGAVSGMAWRANDSWALGVAGPAAQPAATASAGGDGTAACLLGSQKASPQQQAALQPLECGVRERPPPGGQALPVPPAARRRLSQVRVWMGPCLPWLLAARPPQPACKLFSAPFSTHAPASLLPHRPAPPQWWVVDSPLQASLALETDAEFFAKFASYPNPREALIDYAGDLIGCEFAWRRTLPACPRPPSSHPRQGSCRAPLVPRRALPLTPRMPPPLPQNTDADVIFSRELGVDLTIGAQLAGLQSGPLFYWISFAAPCSAPPALPPPPTRKQVRCGYTRAGAAATLGTAPQPQGPCWTS